MQFSQLSLSTLCVIAAIGCEDSHSAARLNADRDVKAGNDAAIDAGPTPVSFGRVFEILNQQCLPCHSSTPAHPNASAKLDFGTQPTAYDQLVGALAKGGPCNDGTRVLVVAGDEADSLLIQKLENADNVCGSPMPKASADQPFAPIDAAQLDEIKTWIHGGALDD